MAMASVTVLRRHNNDFGEHPEKVPLGEAAEGKLSAYRLPDDYAGMLARQGLVEIVSVDDDQPLAEAPEPAPPAKPRRS